jgi:hypothetical protein
MTMPRNGNGHLPALLADPQRVAFERARAQHHQALPDIIPYYEKTCKQIAECVRLDELSNIVKENDKLRAIARILENQEAEINLAEIKLRALRRLGELSFGLKKATGPGRGKRLPRRGKSFRLKRAGISTSTAQRGEQLYKMRDELDRYLGEWREQNRPAHIADLLRRRQLRPGIETRPWTDDVEGLFESDAKGPSDAGRLCAKAMRLSVPDKIEFIIALGGTVPEQWHDVLAWVFRDRQANKLAQDLYQRPVAEREPHLRRLAQKHGAIVALDWNEQTKEFHHQQKRHQPRSKKKIRHAEA